MNTIIYTIQFTISMDNGNRWQEISVTLLNPFVLNSGYKRPLFGLFHSYI